MGSESFHHPTVIYFSTPFLIYSAPFFLGGVANLYLEISPTLTTSRHHGMGRSLVPLDRKEMALVSLQRMPEEKRQKALPAVKQGILKRRGPFPVRVTNEKVRGGV